ncbi:MAG TPA: hypothetical protein VI233_01160, partial [Puia sp.]
MKKIPFLLTAILVSTASFLYAQTTEESVKLAHAIETDISAGKSTSLDHFFDIDKLVENIFKNTKVPNNQEFIDGFKTGFAGNMNTYGPKIVTSTRGGSYKMLKAYQKDGH